MVFQGYSDGKPYEEIRAEVEKLGHQITKTAIGNYWRDIWREEHERLREAHANVVLLRQALEMQPHDPSREVAEELLYTLVFQAFPLLKKEGPLRLLTTAFEQDKQKGKRSRSQRASERGGEATEAETVRRRWRELYGMPAEAAQGDATDGNEETNSEEK